MSEMSPENIATIIGAAIGFAGSFLGAALAFVVARHQRQLENLQKLRSLLIDHRFRVWSAEDIFKVLRDDYICLFQAYEDVRATAWQATRRKFEKGWLEYTGGSDSIIMPSFYRTKSVEQTGTGISVTSRRPDKGEILDRIEALLKLCN
jgi:hypothetical protein